MSKQVMKHINFLSLLAFTDEKQRYFMLKTMNDQQFKVLVECVYNILYGSVQISPRYKKKLYTHKTVIRKITEADITREHRRKILLKHHSILPTLLKILLPQLQE